MFFHMENIEWNWALIIVWFLLLDSPSYSTSDTWRWYMREERETIILNHSSRASPQVRKNWRDLGWRTERQHADVFRISPSLGPRCISLSLSLSSLPSCGEKYPAEPTIQGILMYQTEMSLPWTQAGALLLQLPHLPFHIETMFLCSVSYYKGHELCLSSLCPLGIEPGQACGGYLVNICWTSEQMHASIHAWMDKSMVEFRR